MQHGQIIRWRGHWYLKYYFDDLVDGRTVRRRTTKRLAPINDTYRTEKSVASLAQEILAPLNLGQSGPEGGLTLTEFVETRFLPHVAARRKPSTHKFYREAFENHLRDRVGAVRLRDFTTRHAQQVLDAIPLSHQSLLRIKTAMSAVFTYARQQGAILTANPVQGSKAEGKHTKPKRYAYSLAEVRHMLAVLPEPASTVVATAAFTGLREGELRGLRWEDYTGEELNVRRSIWRTHVGDAKTESSDAAVPVIPPLRRMLDEHRKRSSVSVHAYIFAGERQAFALNLDNLSRRIISPALKGKWHGWHAFRRGIATNLYTLKVAPKVIQSILRHASVETTQKHYVIIDGSQGKRAMRELSRVIESKVVPRKAKSKVVSRGTNRVQRQDSKPRKPA